MDPEEKPEESGRISLHRLRILEALEEEPEVRQLDLAVRLGVALGTVNWHLKRLAAKGCIKVKKIGRWRWRYILTPQGDGGEGAADPGLHRASELRVPSSRRHAARR